MSIQQQSSRSNARANRRVVAGDEGTHAAIKWRDGREATGSIETVVNEQGIFWFRDDHFGQRSIVYMDEIAYWHDLPS